MNKSRRKKKKKNEYMQVPLGFLGGSVVRNPPAMKATWA